MDSLLSPSTISDHLYFHFCGRLEHTDSHWVRDAGAHGSGAHVNIQFFSFVISQVLFLEPSLHISNSSPIRAFLLFHIPFFFLLLLLLLSGWCFGPRHSMPVSRLFYNISVSRSTILQARVRVCCFRSTSPKRILI